MVIFRWFFDPFQKLAPMPQVSYLDVPADIFLFTFLQEVPVKVKFWFAETLCGIGFKGCF